MIPMAYDLKRFVAQNRHRFWGGEVLKELPAAPVYLFPDQEQFDSDEVDLLARRNLAAPLKLPHWQVLFEVTHRIPPYSAVVAYVVAEEDELYGFLFLRDRATPVWTDVMCTARFLPGGTAEVSPHPRLTAEEEWRDYASGLTGLVWRSLGLLAHGTTVEPQSFPQTRRPKLARRGVSGWIYHVALIDLSRIKAEVREQPAGTHASPRWHIRRGHWRSLSGGRRIFIRECEVGDPARGGVLKDYAVPLSGTATHIP